MSDHSQWADTNSAAEPMESKQEKEYGWAFRICVVLGLLSFAGGIIKALYDGGWKDAVIAVVMLVVLVLAGSVLDGKVKH